MKPNPMESSLRLTFPAYLCSLRFGWGIIILTFFLLLCAALSSPSLAQTTGLAGRYAGRTSNGANAIAVALSLSGPDDDLSGSVSVFSDDLSIEFLVNAEVTGTASGGEIFLQIGAQGFFGSISDADSFIVDFGVGSVTLDRLPEQLDEFYVARIISGLEPLDAVVRLQLDGGNVTAAVNVLELDGAVRIADAEALTSFSPSAALEVVDFLVEGRSTSFSDLGLLLNGGEEFLFRLLGSATRFVSTTEVLRVTVASLSFDPPQILTAENLIILVDPTTVIQDEQGVFLNLEDVAQGAALEIRGERQPLGDIVADTVIVLDLDTPPTGGGAARTVSGIITQVRQGAGDDLIITLGSQEFTIPQTTPVSFSDGRTADASELTVGQTADISLDAQDIVLSVVLTVVGGEMLETDDEMFAPNNEMDQPDDEMLETDL